MRSTGEPSELEPGSLRRGASILGLSVRRPLALGVLAALAAIFGLAQLPALHTMGSHGAGIFDFELVRTASRAREITSELGTAGRSAARTSLWLDYGFLITLFAFLAFACIAVSDRARAVGHLRWAAFGVALRGPVSAPAPSMP
jgi:hypothetical protein